MYEYNILGEDRYTNFSVEFKGGGMKVEKYIMKGCYV